MNLGIAKLGNILLKTSILTKTGLSVKRKLNKE